MEKDVNVRFSDVAGVDEAKEELREVDRLPEDAGALRPPGRASCRRASCSSGRRAPARRCSRARSRARPACRSSRSAARTSSRCSWASARRACATCSSRRKQKAPCIIFIDELDALGKARGVGPVAATRARADAESAARRAGRLRRARRRDPGGRHQPPRDPRPGAAAGRALRSPGAGRSPRQAGAPARSSSCTRARCRSNRPPIWTVIAAMTAGFVGRRPREHHQRGGAAGRARRTRTRSASPSCRRRSSASSPASRRRTACCHPTRRSASRTTSSVTRWSRPRCPATTTSTRSRSSRAASRALGYTMQLPTEDRFLMTRERAGEPGGDAARRARRRGADLRRGVDRRARRSQQGDRHRAQHGQDASA